MNKLRQNGGLETWYEVIFWRHKQRTLNTNDQRTPLNEHTHTVKILCVRHWLLVEPSELVNCFLFADFLMLRVLIVKNYYVNLLK